MNRVILSPEYFPNPTVGRPISSADIYVGEPDLDPEVVGNQKQISVQQEDGSIVQVTQPISTGAGGVPLYSGSPVTILVDGNYSLKVLDKQGSQIYYVPSVADYSPTQQTTTIHDLVSITGQSNNDSAYVLGFYAASDGGGGLYVWDSTADKATANGGTIIDPDNIGTWDGTQAQLSAQYYGASGQGTGVGTGCWIQKNNPDTNLKWFGALGDGVVDDLSAFGAALDAVIADGNGKLYIPSGKYLLSTNIAKTLTGSVSLNIEGEGREIVELYWPNASSGLSITYSANGWWTKNPNGNASMFNKMTLVTDNVGAGTAIFIDGNGTSGRPQPPTVLSNITFRGNGTGNTWLTGIYFRDVSSTFVSDCVWQGKITTRTGTFIEYNASASGIDPVQHKVLNPEVTYAEFGIVAADYIEGIHVTNGDFVFVKRAVSWATTTGESELTMVNSHVNAYEYGIYLKNVQDNQIVSNLIWSSGSGVNSVPIFLDGSGRTSIIGNSISTDAAGSGITYTNNVTGSSSWFDDKPTVISGNNFNTAASAINLTTLTANVFVGADNKATNVTVRVTDNGTNTVEKISHAITVVKTLTGGAANETIDVAIPASIFAAKPSSAFAMVVGTSEIIGWYDYDSASSTATNARFRVATNSGGNIGAGDYRFSIVMFE